MVNWIPWGIDLGTTNSVIALFASKYPEVLPNKYGEKLTPSAVSIRPGKAPIVGQKAMQAIELSSKFAHSQFKPHMGSDDQYEFEGIEKKYTATELSSLVLQELAVIRSQKSDYAAVDAVVVTVPAALAFGSKQNSGHDSFSLVYDLSANTFNVALLQRRDSLFEFIDHAGDNHLGGLKLDKAIRDEIILPQIEAHERDAITKDKAEMRRLETVAEEAKCFVTFDDEYLSSVQVSGKDFDFFVTAEQVRRLETRIFSRTVDLCRELLTRNSLKTTQVEKIVMVGSQTRSEHIRKMLHAGAHDPTSGREVEGLSIQLDTTVDPMTAVAQGAAIYGASQRLEIDYDHDTEIHLEDAFEINLANIPPSVSSERRLVAGVCVDAPEDTILIAQRFDGGVVGWETQIEILENGVFSVQVPLNMGPNPITFVAKDITGQETSRADINITRSRVDPGEIKLSKGIEIISEEIAMSELRTEFTAPSLDEAKTGAIHKLPKGHELIDMTVVTKGKPAKVYADAETRGTARKKAMAALPTEGPEVNVDKVTVDYTKRDTQIFKTFQSDFRKTAQQLHAQGKFGELRVLDVSSKRKWSILGFNRYEHTVDLAGNLRAEVQYHQDAMVVVISKPFMVPVELNTFLRNPLSTLGLLPIDAVPRRVTERAGELHSLIEIGMDPAVHLDDFVEFSFLANGVERSISDVDAAKARLISDLDRLTSERFWFSVNDPDTTDALSVAADYKEALLHMDRLASKGAAEPRYAAALLRWYRNNSCELTNDISRADSLINYWLDSLNEWRQLHADGTLLECITLRAEKLTDLRVNEPYLVDQAQQMLIELCEPVVMLAKAAHAQEFSFLAKAYLGAIRDADFPNAVSDHVLEQFFGSWIQTLRAAIESLTAGDSMLENSNKQTEKASEYIMRYQGADLCGDKLKKQIDELKLVLISRAKKAHSVFEGADNQFFSYSSNLVDVWNQCSEVAEATTIVDLFETHKRDLGELQGARDRCIKGLKDIRSVAEEACTVTKAFPIAAKDIKKILDQIDEWQETTKKEFNSTKKHLVRNCDGIREQLP